MNVEIKNPLTTYWSKNTNKLEEFVSNLFLDKKRCKMDQNSLVKKQNQVITYTTHFRSVYVPKNPFFAEKSCALWWRTVKKTKSLFAILLKR